MKDTPKIIFLGTPDFSVATLKALYENGFNIAGVVTAPDQPAGRGLIMQMSSVKKYALENDLRIFQPVKLKEPAFLDEIKKINPDLMIVVAFRMMPKELWQIPVSGTFNLHASLLPQYRGAAPINWAVMNGETETGVTTFFLQQEIDTGNIILSEKVPLGENETAGELHDKLMDIGAKLVIQTVRLIQEGNVKTISQDNLLKDKGDIKTAPKIFKTTCKINWNESVNKVYNHIRGLSPYPAAFTELQSPDGDFFILKIFKAQKEKSDTLLRPYALDTDGKFYFKISCQDGFIDLKEVQLEGKKKMPVDAFLRGFRVDNSWKIKN